MILLMTLHVILHNLDEHYFNKNRNHSKAEVYSNISDGVLFLIPLLFATFVTYEKSFEVYYKVLAGISMVSIVKNEIFYKDLDVKERVVHACMYVLHPILLFNFYESWQNNYFSENTNFWMFQLLYVGFGFKSISYQLIYWNYIHENKAES